MLIVLGFLIAALIGLLIVPAYRRRTERLAIEKIKRAMPLTEAEIRADKDRLRADYALTIHELEYGLETATLAAARQRVEINRRDAVISGLEDEVGQLRTSLEGHENARRVLEQTIMDRLPKVEQRLAEARKLLIQRDREVATLSQTAQKQARALEDASQLNAQTRDEVHRLTAALNVRSSRNRPGMKSHDIEDEVALRTELETLRAKVRDQSGQITELEGLLAVASDGEPTASQDSRDRKDHRAEVVRLRSELSEAEAALRSAQSAVEASRRGRSHSEAEIEALKAKAEDQSAEIGRLRAGLAAYQAAEKDHKSLAQSKLAMHSRIAILQAQTEDQAQKILSLKAEVAAANERTALQAAHYTDELRQLSAHTAPPGGSSLRGSILRSTEPDKRRSLTERISTDRVAARRGGEGESQKADTKNDAPGPAQTSEATDASRRTGFSRDRVGEPRPRIEREAAEVSISRHESLNKTQLAPADTLSEERDNAADDAAHDDRSAKRSPPGLLERITRLDRAE